MRKFFILYFLFLSMVLLVGCEYKSGLGLNKSLPIVGEEKISGWRVKSGNFIPSSPEYSTLTGEVKILKNDDYDVYAVLEDNFSTGKVDESFSWYLYLTDKQHVKYPSDLDSIVFKAIITKSGFQYFLLKDKKTKKFLDPLKLYNAVLFDPYTGKIAGIAPLYQVEPVKENF
jgi:hypothetical protein